MKKVKGLFLGVCLLGFGLLLASCDNGITDNSAGGVVGTWAGQYQFDGMTVLVTWELRPDLTVTTREFVPALGFTIEVSGTYSVSGNTITVRSDYGYTQNGTISGNTIIFVVEGIVIILTRQ